jgi:aspartyl-tRNA(Asn)/glutamyl-tRNA(Gln) amidotransferase subunit B
MPVVNGRAVEYALRIGRALNCRVAERSVFSRKNYFYPDLPKNYQISQYDLPLCTDGFLEIAGEEGESVRVGITRVHMEEDTGKSSHEGEGGGRIHDATHTLLDFNRSGVPLMEVVSEPDLRSARDAREYVSELRNILLRLGVSDAKLEEGSLRFDANVSVRPAGTDEFGTKIEIKNMNSLRSLQRALEYEINRQATALEAGDPLIQETRHWNEEKGVTTSMRSKEEAFDYRYFPEPDLLEVHVDADWWGRVGDGMPELPADARARYAEIGLDAKTAALIARDAVTAARFDGAVAAGAEPGVVANWLTGEVTAHLRKIESDLGDTDLTGAYLAELAGMVAGRDLSATAAKEVLTAVMDGEGAPRAVAEAKDLIQVSDADALGPIVDQVLGENPDAVAKLVDGDDKVIGFLIGQVMRASGGKADPGKVKEMITGKVG